MNNEENEILAIDQIHSPILNEDECIEFKPIIRDFIGSYAKNKDKPVEEWLANKMQESLPDRSMEEIRKMTDEIITAVKISEEKKISLSKSVSNGRSKESWFASEMKQATSAMSAQESSKYLAGLDSALNDANGALYRTITTQAGKVSQNPRLDGFIAEQYHAQTFNMNAKASGSPYRAKVLEPNGSRYSKNSVDVVIKDGNGNVVKRYQSKYCKDADATIKAFEKGDYRGQQKLVPDGQQSGIGKKCTNVISSPDGIKSNPLSKSRAEQMRNEAQSGKWNDLNWNEYKAKDLALGIGKQTCYAALQGAVIGVGFDVAQKLWNGEDVNAEDVVETALTSGADFGVKVAAAGALKVGVEKDIIKVIPKGTPAGTIANIAFVAIENVKVIGKMATGDLSFKEGINKLEETTVSAVAGLAAMAKGTALGVSVGTVFGPAGQAVGGFIGGTVGFIAGSTVGKTVVKGAQMLRDGAKKAAKAIRTGAKNTAKSFVNGAKNLWNGIKNLLSF